MRPSPLTLATLAVALTLGLAVSFPSVGTAGVIGFQDDLAGFESAAGWPVPIRVDFDSLTPGTDLTGASLAGATFGSPDGNSLEVVVGVDTFTPGGFSGVVDPDTNRLFPTSGANVLSPGGEALVPGSALAEEDSLEILFAVPQQAVGLDLLFQSLDSGANTTVQAFGPGGASLAFLSVATAGGAGGAPGGSFFIGFVSDDVSTHIARLLVTESDGNRIFPDSNIGYDTLRYVIPEPGAAALLLLGLLQLAAIARRAAGKRSSGRR